MRHKIERRNNDRRRLERPVKLRLVDSHRCVTGQMYDISPSGLLVNIDQASKSLVRGQRLLVGIAWTSQQVLLHSSRLVKATVIRCSGLGDSQQVAIQFDQHLELSSLAAAA